MLDMIDNELKQASELFERLASEKEFAEKIQATATLLQDSLLSGHKILLAGNGGSASDAEHFAAEIIIKYEKLRGAYPALALTADSSVLTAAGNDYGFPQVFARQVEGLGSVGDVFVGISTSGKSENVIEALQAAKKQQLKTVSLLGRDGGAIKGLSDLELIVPSDKTSRIQEVHRLVIHVIMAILDKNLK